MKTLAIIAITCLIATTFAVSEQEFNTKVQKMEQSKYGRTLLATVALELENEGPVEDLIQMMQNTEHELQDEQRADDEFIWALIDECDADIANLQAEIKAAKLRIEQLSRELGEKIPIRDQKVVERDRKIAFRNLIHDKVAELDANKELKDAEWAEEQRQHDEAAAVIEKAKQIIADAMRVEFLQRADKTASAFAQVSQTFKKHSASKFNRKSWNRIFSMLSQITAAAPIQADQSAVEKVMQLCDDLLGKIAESREIERRDYEHWVNEYQTTRDALMAKSDELTGQINQLDNEIDTLTKRINEATAERASQEERRDAKQEEHDARLEWCNQEQINYSNRRQARQEEIEVVSDCIALLQANLRLFREYVKNRLDSITRPE